jgi:hypothetical protein
MLVDICCKLRTSSNVKTINLQQKNTAKKYSKKNAANQMQQKNAAKKCSKKKQQKKCSKPNAAK